MGPDYTVVIGVDAKHLAKLALVTQTWAKHKPSLFRRPWIIFIDDGAVDFQNVLQQLPILPEHYLIRYWPDENVVYPSGIPGDKWTNPQRYKMLAGFVHVPAMYVRTKYWLKIDLDVVATGNDDWVEEDWFDSYPVIVAPKWHYTKPPNQMDLLDQWVNDNKPMLPLLGASHPLNLHPAPDATLLKHNRIASWCAFFETEFTKLCSRMAEKTCSPGLMPVPSQDGFHWYCAARLGLGIVTPPMKHLGWEVKSSISNITEAVRRSLA